MSMYTHVGIFMCVCVCVCVCVLQWCTGTSAGGVMFNPGDVILLCNALLVPQPLTAHRSQLIRKPWGALVLCVQVSVLYSRTASPGVVPSLPGRSALRLGAGVEPRGQTGQSEVASQRRGIIIESGRKTGSIRFETFCKSTSSGIMKSLKQRRNCINLPHSI